MSRSLPVVLGLSVPGLLLACAPRPGSEVAAESGDESSLGETDGSSADEVGSSANSDATGGDGDGDCDPALPVLSEAPELLSETGLYTDTASKELAPHVRSFTPQFPLWTDGAVKHRWIYLPGCEPIDTSDMDYWSFPVGTRAWKSFVVSLEGGDLTLETRLIARTGPGEDDFLFATYLWDLDEQDAQLLLDGLSNVRGTQHDVPDENQCRECHGGAGSGGWGGGGDSDAGGTPSRILGFGAIQLSHEDSALDLLDLIDSGRLTDPPPGFFAVPDGMNGTAAPVLGNFHGNCGHCHNTSPDGVADVAMDLFLSVNATTVESTGAYTTTVNVPSDDWQGNDLIVPGDPQNSEVYIRDAQRGPGSDQMPPLGTEVVDAQALADLEAWICELAPCN